MIPPAPLKGDLNLLNLSYVKRWVVAPMYRDQSVAEHTFRVMAIALELAFRCKYEIPPLFLEAVMAHDDEEIMTGDCPGPHKSKTPGYLGPLDSHSPSYCLLKVADSLETGTWWMLWGHRGWAHPYNEAPERDIRKIEHYAPKIPGLLEAAQQVWEEITGESPWQIV